MVRAKNPHKGIQGKGDVIMSLGDGEEKEKRIVENY